MTDERAQRRLLTAHFFKGFFDNDLVSPGSDLHGVLAKFAAVLVLPGVLFPVSLVFKYGYPFRSFAEMEVVSWSDKCIFVTLSLIVTGLVTVLEWDALQLAHRDGMVLGALPVRGRTILEAKMLAVGKFLFLVAGTLAALGALTFPVIMHERWPASLHAIGATALAHVAASMGAAGFIFFTLFALHSAMHLLLGPAAFRRASGAIQMVATFLLAVALLMLPFIASSTRALKETLSPLAGLAPQMWFMGIYETVSGHGDAQWTLLASRGAVALAASALVAITTSLLAYRQLLGRAVDAVQAGRPGRTWVARLLDLLGGVVARHPVERGFYSFTVATLFRSAWHRVMLAAFLGIAIALSLAAADVATFTRDGRGHVAPGEPHLLFVELLVVAIVLGGVRAAAASPAELKASWVLQLIDARDARRWMAGFRKAIMVTIVVPLVGVLSGFVWMLAGGAVAWPHALVQLFFATVLLDSFFLGFDRVPFACPFDGGGGTFKVRWLAFAALLTTVLFPVCRQIVISRASPRGAGTLGVLAAVILVSFRLASLRARGRRPGLRFEPEDTSTQSLGLGTS